MNKPDGLTNTEGLNHKLRKELFIVRTNQKADDGESRATVEGAGRIPVGAADSAEECPCARNNSDPQQQRLLEKVVATGNMKRAWKQVKRNKGSYGIDGRTIANTEAFLKTEWPDIRQKILDETFNAYFIAVHLDINPIVNFFVV